MFCNSLLIQTEQLQEKINKVEKYRKKKKL